MRGSIVHLPFITSRLGGIVSFQMSISEKNGSTFEECFAMGLIFDGFDELFSKNYLKKILLQKVQIFLNGILNFKLMI